MTKKKQSKVGPEERRVTGPEPAIDPTAGALFDYVVCPLCGRNRVAKSVLRLVKNKDPTLRWDYVNPATADFVQVRQQHKCLPGWKCKGFTKVPGKEKTVLQAYNDPKYRPVVLGMLQQLHKLISDLEELGVVL